jgi:hypothetical protein
MRIYPFVFTAVLAVSTVATEAAVSFSFNFTDPNGVGFNDNSQGAARRAAHSQAANIVSSLFSGYTATIVMDVDGSNHENGTLAAAGSNYNAADPGTGFGSKGDVMLKILGGDAADPAPALADGSVTWNFQTNLWELGNDFQTNEYDFISTAAHELLHAVGFASDITQNGQDSYGTPAGTAGIWSPFDRWVSGPSGSIINSTNFKLDITRWNAASTGGSTKNGMGLSFAGPNTLAAHGGLPIYIYSPSSWSDGSSGSHLDDDLYNGTYIMEAATNPGLGIRTFSPVEQAMLRDIGYTLVPEPGAFALLASAVGVLGLRPRRSAA